MLLVASVSAIIHLVGGVLAAKNNVVQNRRKSKRLVECLEAILPPLRPIEGSSESKIPVAHRETLEKLKKAGSAVALHDSPTCSVETGVCKMDLMVDKGKTRLLYLPGVAGGLIVFCEASFWFLHLDPILSIVLGIVPVFFFGKFFTENIFAQSPLVVTAPCPAPW